MSRKPPRCSVRGGGYSKSDLLTLGLRLATDAPVLHVSNDHHLQASWGPPVPSGVSEWEKPCSEARVAHDTSNVFSLDRHLEKSHYTLERNIFEINLADQILSPETRSNPTRGSVSKKDQDME